MKIERTLFWFRDGDEMLIKLNENFFGLSNLLNRLLNEKYDGKKINFINLDFSTNKTYQIFSSLPKNEPYCYGGHLRFYGEFDFEQFNEFSRRDQVTYIWENMYKYIRRIAESIKNDALLRAIEYAYLKGIEKEFNTDYAVLEKDIIINNEQLKASVWINFEDDYMHSSFTLEKLGKIIYKKSIDKAKNGVEYFLEIYKEIECLNNNNVVIKGSRNVEYLPLTISLKEFY